MLRTGKRGGDADAGVYPPAEDTVGTESLAVRDWEEFDTHCRGTDLPGRHGNAGAWHGARVADWPHVRPRRGRCGVERLVQWGVCARLPQGAGSDLRPPLSGPRGYQRLQHGLRICQYGRARKPGMAGATATFLAQFAAHAAGHDACTGFCRGLRTGESLKSRVRSRHWGGFRSRAGAGSARVNLPRPWVGQRPWKIRRVEVCSAPTLVIQPPGPAPRNRTFPHEPLSARIGGRSPIWWCTGYRRRSLARTLRGKHGLEIDLDVHHPGDRATGLRMGGD